MNYLLFCHVIPINNMSQVPLNIRPFPPSLPPDFAPHCSFRPIEPHTDAVRKAYYWVETSKSHEVPSTALLGGKDADAAEIYVGRAYFNGDWIPAKVIPQRHEAFVAYEGSEHIVDRFQVLCEQRFDWVKAHADSIPQNAVEGGKTCDGEPLYIGRVHHKGSHTVGKVHRSYKCCFIPFGGEELAFSDYEILVLRS